MIQINPTHSARAEGRMFPVRDHRIDGEDAL
jgi:hypothetical protein